MTFNRDINHRRSIRLRDYDYSGAGAYFVTICAVNRECLFGEVLDGSMQPNEAGLIVEECWQTIPHHFSHIDLDEMAVMPNHIHGIIVLTPGTACRAPTVESFGCPVAGSLPTIVRSFKSAVTKRINELRENRGAPVWQRNYYEHVIRDENDLHSIRQYIADNPVKWADDENHPAR